MLPKMAIDASILRDTEVIARRLKAANASREIAPLAQEQPRPDEFRLLARTPRRLGAPQGGFVRSQDTDRRGRRRRGGLELVRRLGARYRPQAPRHHPAWSATAPISGSRCCTKWRRGRSTPISTRSAIAAMAIAGATASSTARFEGIDRDGPGAGQVIVAPILGRGRQRARRAAPDPLRLPGAGDRRGVQRFRHPGRAPVTACSSTTATGADRFRQRACSTIACASRAP